MTAAVLLILAMASKLAWSGVNGATSSPVPGLINSTTEAATLKSYSDTFYAGDAHPDYPECSASASYIGDGLCNYDSNNAQCGWDGGDCCVCSCVVDGNDDSAGGCTPYMNDCKDPDASIEVSKGCVNVSIHVPEVSRCPEDIQFKRIVKNTSDAAMLADTILCSHGNFEVEWRGHVRVNTTILVVNRTNVRIFGNSDAIVDGGGTIQIFLVTNGSLHLSNLRIKNGTGAKGGAIIAAAGSEVHTENVIFSSNTAHDVGGAIYAHFSTVVFTSTAFSGNNAFDGGALFLRDSLVHGSGFMEFISNNAGGNGGALYITSNSYVGWNMQPTVVQTRYTYPGYSSSNDTYSYDTYYPDIEWIPVDHGGETVFENNSAGGSGGAIYASDDCEIIWTGSTSLERNTAQYGGAIYMENGVSVKANGTTNFLSNDAALNGGAIDARNNGEYAGFYSVNQSSILFENNTCGENGGAVDLSELYISVKGNWSFIHNSAASLGGALYAFQVTTGPRLTGASFSENSAKSGGAVYFSGVGSYYQRSYYDDEEAPVYASEFIDCRFDRNSATSTGGAIHSAAGVNIVKYTIFTGNSADDGGALYSSGKLSLLNSSFIDNTSGEGEGAAISNSGVLSDMVALLFTGNTHHCSRDTFRDFNQTAMNSSLYEILCNGCDEECQECNIERSRFIPVCTELLDHADSQGGTATLETLHVDKGYWRATNKSRNVLECLNTKACRGGVTGDLDYCMAGYEGPFSTTHTALHDCAVCSPGYATTLPYHCNKCLEKTSLGIFVVAILASIVVCFLVCCMLSIGGHRNTGGSIASIEAIMSLQSFKIILVSWQIVTQFTSMANVVYPSLYQGVLDAIAFVNFNFSWVVSTGCIMDVDFHDELVAATASPLVVVAMLGLTYIIAVHRNHESERALRKIRRKHANAAILVAFLFYSSASSAVFRAFACESLDDDKEYLRSDYRIECDSPKHRAFQIYAGFMIVVYPLGIPMLFAMLLFRSRRVLTNAYLRTYNGEMRQQSTSSLWKAYRPSVFYYEVVECGRRVMLTGVVVFIYPNTSAQVAVTLAIAFIFALTSERLNPYNSNLDGWVSRTGHVMVVLTMYVALLTKVDVSSEGNQSQNIFAAILVSAHIAMVLTAFVEAVVLIYSVRQRDVPRTISRSTSSCMMPVDNFL